MRDEMNALFQEYVDLTSWRELTGEPFKLSLNLRGIRSRKDVVEERDGRARSPQAHAHLMDCLRIQCTHRIRIACKMP